MYNVRVAQPVGVGLLTGKYDYSDRAEMDYQDLSLDRIARRGYDKDNFFPNYASAISAALACQAKSGTCAMINTGMPQDCAKTA
jgi:hypothetical protein